MKYIPQFDKGFKPCIIEINKFNDQVKLESNKKLNICVERNDGYNYIYSLNIFLDPAKQSQNTLVVDRIVKSILWIVGGYKIYVDDKAIYDYLKQSYSASGSRQFDWDFMQTVYEKPFEVILCDDNNFPKLKACSLKVGGNTNGCRIGFDAGGSDRKVSAVIDGEVIYSEEVVWFPKITSDPNYHYEEILSAMKTASSKMPRVDAIGVSSAGVYVDNKVMVASLFLQVDKEKHHDKVKNIYTDIAKNFGNVPLTVANDGDVTALAGAIDLEDTNVLGIAMGTSEAVGYINSDGGLSGYLSELAFVPVDFNSNAMQDEWSGDIGVGVKYFSQDSVIKLAGSAGFQFEKDLSPAEKLKVIQNLNKENSPLAEGIFEDIGVYLGYTLPFYALFYDIKHVILLGRVTSGKGGDIVLATAKKVLAEEFPELNINLSLPSEKSRRVGQSITASTLPKIQ